MFKYKIIKFYLLKKKYNQIKNRNCRICYEYNQQTDKLTNPCKCKGSIKYIHHKCLLKWIKISNKDYCPQCHYKYKIKKNIPYPLLKNNILKISSLILLFLIILSGLFFKKIFKLKLKFISFKFFKISVQIFSIFFLIILTFIRKLSIFYNFSNLDFILQQQSSDNLLFLSFQFINFLITNLSNKLNKENVIIFNYKNRIINK